MKQLMFLGRRSTRSATARRWQWCRHIILEWRWDRCPTRHLKRLTAVGAANDFVAEGSIISDSTVAVGT